MWPVGPSEVAAVHPDPHGTNESRRDHVDQRVGQFARGKRLSLRHGRIPFAVRSQRKVIGHACSLDTRNRAYAGEDLLEDLAAFDLAGFAGWGAIVILDFNGGGAVGLKTEVDVEHLHKAAQ